MPSSTIFSKFGLSDSQAYSVLMLLKVLTVYVFFEKGTKILKMLQKSG